MGHIIPSWLLKADCGVGATRTGRMRQERGSAGVCGLFGEGAIQCLEGVCGGVLYNGDDVNQQQIFYTYIFLRLNHTDQSDARKLKWSSKFSQKLNPSFSFTRVLLNIKDEYLSHPQTLPNIKRECFHCIHCKMSIK